VIFYVCWCEGDGAVGKGDATVFCLGAVQGCAAEEEAGGAARGEVLLAVETVTTRKETSTSGPRGINIQTREEEAGGTF
jgi:hypothetical protein